jgi:hypothetical protein
VKTKLTALSMHGTRSRKPSLRGSLCAELPEPDGLGEDREVLLPAMTSLKIELYGALQRAGINRAELTRRLGWNRNSVDRLFQLGHASRLDKIEAAAEAMGWQVQVGLGERSRLVAGGGLEPPTCGL